MLCGDWLVVVVLFTAAWAESSSSRLWSLSGSGMVTACPSGRGRSRSGGGSACQCLPVLLLFTHARSARGTKTAGTQVTAPGLLALELRRKVQPSRGSQVLGSLGQQTHEQSSHHHSPHERGISLASHPDRHWSWRCWKYCIDGLTRIAKCFIQSTDKSIHVRTLCDT
jgi:hypothetical protein